MEIRPTLFLVYLNPFHNAYFGKNTYYSPHKKVFTAECAEIKLGFAENRRVLFSYFFRRAGFVLNVELDLQSSSLLLLGFPIRYLFIFLCIILVLFILRIKSSAWRLHSKNPYSNYEVDCKSTSTDYYY